MREVTFVGNMKTVKGVDTFMVTGQWFNDQLVSNFFEEMEWKEIDEEKNTSTNHV